MVEINSMKVACNNSGCNSVLFTETSAVEYPSINISHAINGNMVLQSQMISSKQLQKEFLRDPSPSDGGLL